MVRISIMVAKRLTETATLIATARENADILAEKLGQKLEGRDGFESTHIKTVILSQASYLQEITSRMHEAEKAYVDEQDDDIALRGKLAEASIQLDHKLRLTREHIRSAEGPNALQIYGLSMTPPRARDALVSYAHNTIELLSAHPYTFTGELGEVLETRTIAVLLNDLLEPFEQLVDKMNIEVDELQQALGERNRAIDEWVETYRGLSKILEGFCRMAGMHELAENFLPSFERAKKPVHLPDSEAEEKTSDNAD